MQSRLINLGICGLLTICSVLSLSAVNAATVEEDLLRLLTASDSMHASFTQVMHDNDGVLVDQSSGWMAWLRPDKFRWEIAEPFAQSLIIDGRDYYQYDRDLDQLIIQQVTAEVAALPSLLLSGNTQKITEAYRVEQVQSVADTGAVNTGGSRTSYKLIPHNEQSLFKEVTIEFSNGKLIELNIVDDLRQTSRFEFSDTASPQPVTAELFTLQQSEETHVVYQ